MRLLRELVAGLRALASRSAYDRDDSDEVEHFFAEAEAELMRSGLSPEDARRQARLRFGDREIAREAVRSYGWETALESFWMDLRIGGRRLRRNLGFSATVVATLALGVGATVAILQTVRPVFLAPGDYPQPDRLVAITDRTTDGSPLAVTFGTFVELDARIEIFDALAVSTSWYPIFSSGPRPERIGAKRVSAEYFEVLGIPPAIGPGLDPDEDHPGGASLVVLSDGLWRRAFGADPSILGADVLLDDRRFSVVGVMPEGFRDLGMPDAQIWTLLRYDSALPSFDSREWGHHLELTGRASAGLGLTDVRAALDAVAVSPRPAFPRPPWAALAQGFDVRTLHDATFGDSRPAAVAVVGAVLVLLGIACANAVVLLLGWGARRRGELSLRMALGAGRTRVVRQHVLESLLLAGLGGILAAGVAGLGSSLLVRVVPEGLRWATEVGADASTSLVALGASGAIGFAIAAVAALSIGRIGAGGLANQLRARRPRPTRRAFVAAEVALALVLLIGAGLLTRSMGALFAVPVGFEPDGRVAIQIHTAGWDDESESHAYFERALDAVRGSPGVAAAAVTSQLPLSGDESAYGVSFEDAGAVDDVDGSAQRYVVSPSYFEVMGIPVLEGRGLSVTDRAGSPPAVVLSESLARRAFGGARAVGQRVHVGRPDLPWFTVVGVVGDVKHSRLASNETDAVYLTPDQWYFADDVRWIVATVSGDAASLTAGLRQVVGSVDGRQAVSRVEVLPAVVANSEARRSFVRSVLGAFGAIALVLAAIGLFGVVSRSVTERRHELGVRATLGATPRNIVSLVVGQGARLGVLGITAGAAIAALGSRVLESLLYSVSPLDPITYLTTAAIMLVIVVLASWVPAAAAARTDPVATLRQN